MPTVLDVLRTELLDDQRADTIKKHLDRAMALFSPARPCRTETAAIEADLAEILKNLGPVTPLFIAGGLMAAGIGLAIGKMIEHLNKCPPSRGYEPLLIDAGWRRLAARGIAWIAVGHGRRIVQDDRYRRPTVDALRFLANRLRQRRAVFARAKSLLEAYDKSAIIETIFDEAGLSEKEFIQLLRAAVEGREFDGKRLMDLAATVTMRLSLRRGPKVSTPSAALEFLMARGDMPHYPAGLAEATRREFNSSDFDPRPVFRRLKRAVGPSKNHNN